jgi:hypothetical protein
MKKKMIDGLPVGFSQKHQSIIIIPFFLKLSVRILSFTAVQAKKAA